MALAKFQANLADAETLVLQQLLQRGKISRQRESVEIPSDWLRSAEETRRSCLAIRIRFSFDIEELRQQLRVKAKTLHQKKRLKPSKPQATKLLNHEVTKLSIDYFQSNF